MFRDLRQRDNLTRFLPRQVADRVIAQGPQSLAPVEREITVLFSDIRGFTGMSEGMGPRDVLVMLDDYFGRMSQVVKGHDGVVGKFMGDGLLAFWGVPDAMPDHATRAVRAARDMRSALRELNQQRVKDGLPPIKIGIGIHTGPVAAGMLGGALQAEYTVIGDAVNVASRIEGLTKEHAVDVLLSETTWGQLGDGARTRRVAEDTIRGRKEPVVLYTLDPEAAPDAQPEPAASPLAGSERAGTSS
jgi:adenylate cyclase